MLGSVGATCEGRRIELGSPTQRTVFAVLAAHENTVVSKDDLIRAVWGSDASETVMNSVYTYIARLRKVLDPDRARFAQSEVLVSDSLGYLLRVPSERIDARRFTGALSAARRLRADNATERAAYKLEEGLALWRGTPYAGTVGAFVESERERLAETRLLAIEDHAEMLLELGRPALAIGELSALVHRHPLRERLRLLLMRCHIELGRHADAIGEYHSLRIRLAEGQGIEPGESLRELYEQALNADRLPGIPRQYARGRSRAVPTAMPGRTVTVPVAPAVPAVAAGPATALPAAPAAPAPAAARKAPAGPAVRQLPRAPRWFIGRKDDLAALHELLGQADEADESGLILLTGPPGAGKAALATQFARTLDGRFADSQYHLDLRAFPASSPARSAELALRRLNSTLRGGPETLGLDAETEYRSLVADREMLLILDNATSVDQVRPLLPGTPTGLVIVVSRWGLSGLIAQDGARRLVVEPLRGQDASRLFTGIVGETLVAEYREEADRLIAACEGLPLALRVAATLIKISPFPGTTLRRLSHTTDLTSALYLTGDANSTLTTVFDWSYDALPADAAHLYRVLGRSRHPELTPSAGAVLSGLTPEECRRALDALVDAGLLREVAPDRFRMAALLHAHARGVVRRP
ncbi:BTAD domain-containing putative transcriptional regulator [Streptomyces sp. NPDC004111]|uniref:AfsR/SARP family transcriptional regulator n=1 Tax=Streptomyces sp. NPDC004111 TaxID=3364690 RepID=UPI0036CAB566